MDSYKVLTVLLSYLILSIYGLVQSTAVHTSVSSGSGAALIGPGSDAIRMRHIMQGPRVATNSLGAGPFPFGGYYGPPPMPMLMHRPNLQPIARATSTSLAGRKKRQAASSAGAPSDGATAAGAASGRKKRQAAGAAAASETPPAPASSVATSSTGRKRRQAEPDVAGRSVRRKRQILSSASSTSAPLLSMSAGLETSSQSGSGSGSSGQAQVSGSLGGLSGSLSASTGASGTGSSSESSSSSSGSASMSASGSLGTSSSGSEQSALASASLSLGNSTAKPKGGLLTKVKEILKEGKEAVKSSVGSLTKDDKKPSSSVEASGSISTSGGSGLSVSGSASSSNSNNNSGGIGGGTSSSGSSSMGSSSGGSLSASGSIGSTSTSGSSSSGSLQASGQLSVGQKQEGGLIDKLADVAKKGKETIKETASEIKEKAREVKEDLKQAVGLNGQQQQQVDGGSMNAGGSIKVGGIQASANINMGNNSSRYTSGSNSGNQQAGDMSGPVEKVQKLVNKGSEVVRETVHKIEDKAAEVTDKVSKTFEDNIRKPMAQVSGSGQQLPEGQINPEASYNSQLKGDARERHLMDVKRRQESELGQKPNNLKEIISQAKSRGIIPQNEDRSVLAGNHADEKSVAVEVMDKMHEISKMPVETVLRPIDKVLGYEKDPLIRAYDNSHEILRRPLSLVSKPVESMLTGAFKTTDEAKRDHERLLQTSAEQERREAKMREERARKEDRSVVGEIADRTVELAEKPFEIILKPVDHLLGLDKEGKKNPVLKIVDDFYGLSKKPLDSIAKPFESILRKMADNGQGYQVSVRFQTQSGSDSDPKLVTRLADGALNIADRVMTKPLEVVMKPLNHALGYDEPGKRNPIVDSAHSLKNATKLGVELFTRPIDRIIKEIADIGAIKDNAEREAMLERKREETSRLVKLLDKIHELAQSPWEIVLRPVDRALGLGGDGRKEPLLRAWDVIHQVVRAPIQVVSKPVEDALLGEQSRRTPNQQQHQQRAGTTAQISGQLGPVKAGASINLGNSNGGPNNRANVQEEDHRSNKIVEGIKKVERIASRPLNVITSPIRRLILVEDDEKVGSQTEKNNRAIQAKSMGQSGYGRFRNNEGPDKIVKTIENMNNVVLKPLEVITQPISDIL